MDENLIEESFNLSGGILRLKPNFIARRTGTPAKRLRLHPDDYFGFGFEKGQINERWMCSTVLANNGELTEENEGLSKVVTDKGDEYYFLDAFDVLKERLIGKDLYKKYKRWPVFCKFFDNDLPLYFHVHLDDKKAGKIGKFGKPEGYYYPIAYNTYEGQFPYRFYGLNPDVGVKELKEKLLDFDKKDNKILDLSKSYRIRPGTGWYTGPGVLHSPGTLLTYEIQWASDVSLVFENVTANIVNPITRLYEDLPENEREDVENALDVLDLEENTNPNYKKDNFRPAIIKRENDNHIEKWIMYNNPYFSAKEIIVKPKKEFLLKEKTAFGLVATQGHGKINNKDLEAPQLIRLGQNTNDEYFVSYEAANKGVLFKNESSIEDLTILLHFANDNLLVNEEEK